jgi:hypothetical protein
VTWKTCSGMATTVSWLPTEVTIVEAHRRRYGVAASGLVSTPTRKLERLLPVWLRFAGSYRIR